MEQIEANQVHIVVRHVFDRRVGGAYERRVSFGLESDVWKNRRDAIGLFDLTNSPS